MTDAIPAPRRGVALARSSGIVFVGRVVTAIASAVTVAVTAHSLGATGRGELTMILTIVAFLTLVASAGIATSGRILLVDSSEPITFGQYLAVGLGSVVAATVLAPIVTMVVLSIAATRPPFVELLLVAAYGGMTMTAYVLVGALYSLGDAPVGAIYDAANYLLLAGLVSALALGRGLSLQLALGLFAVSQSVTILLSWRRLGQRGFSRRPRVDARAVRRMLALSRPSMAIGLGESATFRADRLLLGMMQSPAVVGVYSVAVTVAEMIRYVPAAINQVLFYEQASGERDGNSVARTRRISVVVMLASMAVAAVAVPPVFSRILGEDFAGAGTLFRILLLSEIGIASYLFDSTTLASRGSVGKAALVAVVGLGVVLVLDITLIPAFAGAGAAWASVGAYSVMAILAARWRSRLPVGVPRD